MNKITYVGLCVRCDRNLDGYKYIRYWIRYQGNEKYLEEIDDFINENDDDEYFVTLDLNDRLTYKQVKLIMDHSYTKEFICVGKMKYNLIDTSDDSSDNYHNISELHYNINIIFDKCKVN